ncbi:MAG: YjhG/YagF family D-xylonate dehydratase [Lentisphaeraceae bacterium]|nr:YjhG/YagF family D-xylonate dehydratase [Lentisphaeraceae bacterium]
MNWWNPQPEQYKIRTKMPARQSEFPLTEEMLLNSPSGHLFGLSQDAGMGWSGKELNNPQVLILTTMGGLRKENGEPIALGFHTGHWELGLLAKEAADKFRELGRLPFAAHCSDPCDGRSQGTNAMMESLAYRNSACEVMGRLIRSLPRAKAVMGIATCDKGLPAMMMALAENSDKAGIIVPGGVSLPPDKGEDAGTVQSIGARFSHGELTVKEAAELGCAACASPGGGCQFLGTAATAQVVAEALGMALPHSALAPSGEQVWLDMASSSAEALHNMQELGLTLNDVLNEDSLHNAMTLHAAFGGSSNLLLHLPAVVYMAGVERPDVKSWENVNRNTPRLVDVLPNGPNNFRTVQVYLAGGVPEVMLHLRELGLLKLNVMTVTGKTLGENLEEWENSERRLRFREILLSQDGVSPDQVIMAPQKAAKLGLSRTLTFPSGNLAPEGAVVKSTAIKAELFDEGIYYHQGPARVFTSEKAAIRAIRSKGEDRIQEGDVIILLCRGALGAGLPETAQITIAMKYTRSLKNVALLTDGRFSGFSSGPCIGHIGPEALAGGPLGKLLDGDLIEIKLDNNELKGSINLLARDSQNNLSAEHGGVILESRQSRSDLQADPELPKSVRLWAALQQSGGGIWGGCVNDVDVLEKLLKVDNSSSSLTKL